MTKALDIFRALADPTRLRIVALLRQMELSIGELAQVLGQSQPRVSRHVKILADAGLAERRKEGSWVFLGLGDEAALAPLLAALDAWAAEEEGDHWAVAEYFKAHAAEWDAIRSLHVAESAVEARIAEALGVEEDGGRGLGRLVDIGTGTGRMIELFGAKAESALGLDRSPEMLRLARAKLAQAGLDRAELRQGDMYALPLASGSADVVILHQVLHYAQQPAAAIAEAARLLAPGGRLLVVDFAPHDREDLRSSAAHARLGFADDQMAHWFAAAGLGSAPPEQLGGGELTVKLWLGRRAGVTLAASASGAAA